jgi:hypothetical protein
MFLPLLATIQNFTYDIKYIIEMTPSIKFVVEIFDRFVWAFGLCIVAWSYLRSVLTIDADFLPDQYSRKLFMACAYDAEQQLLPFTFTVVT